MTNLFRSQRGNTLILAIISTALVVSVGLIAAQLSTTTDSQLNKARVKSLMAYVEGRVRLAALQPAAYTGCNSSTGTSQCRQNSSHPLWTSISSFRINNAKCPAGINSCGIQLRGINFNSNNRTLTASIEYDGTDFSIRPITVSIAVPTEILQSETFTCPDPTPILQGFLADGRPNCQPLPSCNPAAGQYISSINPSNLAPRCSSVCGVQSCGTGKFISQYKWNGGSSCSTSCADTLDPYTVWGEP